MTPREIVDHLDKLGVVLKIRLVVDAPRGVLTPEIRETLATEKPPLLVHLAREAQWEALRHERWGPAADAPGSGIDVPAGRPLPSLDAVRSIMARFDDDPYAAAERAAIVAIDDPEAGVIEP